MKLLLVKTSSLGDLVHAMPAITEAAREVPNLTVDWVVEENLAPVARLHPNVRRVIPVAIRRWRRSAFSNPLHNVREFSAFKQEVQQEDYDLIIDSQGLLKSAAVARFAKGKIHGFNRHSTRESLASNFYHQTHNVPPNQHAALRQKALFAAALNYKPTPNLDYGLTQPNNPSQTNISLEGDSPLEGESAKQGREPAVEPVGALAQTNTIVLLHGTTWPSKEWPEANWQSLATLICKAGYTPVIPAGNPNETERAERIQAACQSQDQTQSQVLSMRPLEDVIHAITNAAGLVSVDTGLGHLAAALGLPLTAIYGATDPSLTGMTGARTQALTADHLPCIPCRARRCRFRMPEDSSSIHPPCYERTTPEAVWQSLQQMLQEMK
ncbi:MAG: lipopolysaccharide heptosyltransferase I [Pseudomonadales bacterium]